MTASGKIGGPERTKMRFFFTALVSALFIFTSVPLLASSEEKKDGGGSEAHGGKSTVKKGSAADAAEHGGSQKKKSDKPDAKATAIPAPPKGPYFNSWIKFPEITGKTVIDGKETKIIPERGTAYIVVFMGSWCVPCQEYLPRLQEIEYKYHDLDAKFIYVFSHDTEKDALKFSKQNNLSTALHGSMDLLKFFHNPVIPSIFVADRYGWLSFFQSQPDKKSIDDLDAFLNIITAI